MVDMVCNSQGRILEEMDFLFKFILSQHIILLTRFPIQEATESDLH